MAKCKDDATTDFVQGQTKKTKGYRESVAKCYQACKGEFGRGMFIYHNAEYNGSDGFIDADCESGKGCFCACYDTSSINCEQVTVKRMDLYKIN